MNYDAIILELKPVIIQALQNLGEEKIDMNITAVKKITKPIFIVQGYNDPRVPVTESEQMRDEIKKNGGDVWYMVAMDEGHGFRKKFNRDYFTNAMSLFWETYLLKD